MIEGSRVTQASEFATRDVLRRSGATEAEINRYLLIGNLTAVIWKKLIVAAGVLGLVLAVMGWIAWGWLTAFATLVVAIGLWFVARVIARDHSTRYQWVDVGGGYVRKDLLDAANRAARS